MTSEPKYSAALASAPNSIFQLMGMLRRIIKLSNVPASIRDWTEDLKTAYDPNSTRIAVTLEEGFLGEVISLDVGELVPDDSLNLLVGGIPEEFFAYDDSVLPGESVVRPYPDEELYRTVDFHHRLYLSADVEQSLL